MGRNVVHIPQLSNSIRDSMVFTGRNFMSYLVGPGMEGDKLSASGTAAARGSEMS